jgi:NTP pyrophosphatase (non-canonical NTP hydrolase)
MAKVKCDCCGEELESKSRHDYRQCGCSQNTFIDGGNDYVRCGGKDLSKILLWNKEKNEYVHLSLSQEKEIENSNLTLNQVVEKIHQTAKEKGWWDQERSPLEIHALIHAEVSEAVEEVREHKEDYYLDEKGKPCGETTELVDAFIRIADYFGYKGWDFEKILAEKMKYNESRSYRHGNKKF